MWFDDFKVTFTPQLIVQENHYYPFGLELAGIHKRNQPDHRWTFNKGSEKTYEPCNCPDEIKRQAFVYETKYRQLDPQLGRWRTVDPKADTDYLVSQSPYSSMDNNPILKNDPNGDCIPCWRFIKKLVNKGLKRFVKKKAKKEAAKYAFKKTIYQQLSSRTRNLTNWSRRWSRVFDKQIGKFRTLEKSGKLKKLDLSIGRQIMAQQRTRVVNAQKSIRKLTAENNAIMKEIKFLKDKMKALRQQGVPAREVSKQVPMARYIHQFRRKITSNNKVIKQNLENIKDATKQAKQWFDVHKISGLK